MARRARKPMTEARLRNVALFYCQRYMVSEARLRTYLARRLARDGAPDGDTGAMAKLVPEIAAEMARLRLVDDREAASAKLRGALRAGYAANAAVGIAARSAMVDRDMAEAELAAALSDAVPELADATPAGQEQQAVLARLALRRARRGPFRAGGQDEATRRRDAGWLGRRGFRFDDIRRALDLDPEEIDGDDPVNDPET